MKRSGFILLLSALTAACGALAGGTIGGTQKPSSPTQLPTQFKSWNTFDVIACAVAPVEDHCPQPIAGVTVKVHIAINPDIYDSHPTNSPDGYTLFVEPDSLVNSDITFEVAGYLPQTVGVLVSDLTKQHNVFQLYPSWPAPAARAPLVLEPDSDGYTCSHAIPAGFAIPDGPERRFWRGDAWGVTLPGAPFVAGGSGRHPERILSWFFDRYDATWQQRILEQNRRNGYTHFTLSWPDSRDGAGQSAPKFAQTAAHVREAIPFVHVMLTSKDFDPANATATDRMAAVSPAIDALITAGFTREDLILGIGWELDTFNEGQKLEDFIHALHAKYPQFDLYVHFTTYKTSWQPDGKPRAQFWEATRGELTGLLYQANQNDKCGLMQAHFNDAQVPASGLEAVGAVLVAWELVAANEFDGDHPNEDDANARTWEVMMTPGLVLASGGGNGWRFPDGRPALASYPR